MIWEDLAAKIAQELREHPKDFLRQETVSKTMHPNMRPLSLKYWKELIYSDYFLREVLIPAIDGPVGNPHEFECFPRLSPQSIQHAYYINMLHKRMRIQLADLDSIVEIGGGYGNFARIARSMGFAGSYKIVDLPEIHELQRTYLDAAAPGHGVEFITLDQIKGGDLLLGTFSISEMPMKQRDYLETKYSDFWALFIGSTDTFESIDNVKYFDQLARRIGGQFTKDVHRNAWFLLWKR